MQLITLVGSGSEILVLRVMFIKHFLNVGLQNNPKLIADAHLK